MFDRLRSLSTDSEEASLLFLKDPLVAVDLSCEETICSDFRLLFARFSFFGVLIFSNGVIFFSAAAVWPLVAGRVI
jgi:hypothetical protein